MGPASISVDFLVPQDRAGDHRDRAHQRKHAGQAQESRNSVEVIAHTVQRTAMAKGHGALRLVETIRSRTADSVGPKPGAGEPLAGRGTEPIGPGSEVTPVMSRTLGAAGFGRDVRVSPVKREESRPPDAAVAEA